MKSEGNNLLINYTVCFFDMFIKHNTQREINVILNMFESLSRLTV